MRDWVVVVFGLVLVLSIIGLSIGWQVYVYRDCRQVGHSQLYCTFRN